jgi:putative mRNA 3-end processing factor
MTDAGIFCPAGDFYIDPWRPVERAVVTHAHSDHARWGMRHYLCAAPGEGVLRNRVGDEASIQGLPFGAAENINGVRVSLHPAGHILGSAQVRIEQDGYVAAVSGDYKTETDPTADAFEPIRCHLFVTESTFGLPIYKWQPQRMIFDEINAWWASNQREGKASLLMGYALGKAQRALAGVDAEIGPIFVHGAVKSLNDAYRRAGVSLPPTQVIGEVEKGYDWSRTLIVAPPSAMGTPWMRRFGEVSTAFLSGWMAIRGARRRRAVDRGFVLSDHVDWPSLLASIAATQAELVWVTHGYSSTVVRYLQEIGIDAEVLSTQWEGELDDGGDSVE